MTKKKKNIKKERVTESLGCVSMRDQETQGRQKAEQMSGSIPVVGSDFALAVRSFLSGLLPELRERGKTSFILIITTSHVGRRTRGGSRYMYAPRSGGCVQKRRGSQRAFST